MARKCLPPRRPSIIRDVSWTGADGQATSCAVGVGFHLSGEVAEVFASDLKIGSAMRLLLEDACVVVSLGLQHGIAPADLAHSMGRTPAAEGTAPASMIGAIVDVLVREEQAQQVKRGLTNAGRARLDRLIRTSRKSQRPHLMALIQGVEAYTGRAE